MNNFLVRVSRLAIVPAVFSFAILLAPAAALASHEPILTAATVNGASSIIVSPSASIIASVTGHSHDNASSDWSAVEWGIPTLSGFHCVNIDNIDHNASTTFFSITAPASAGTYDVNFKGFTNSSCTNNPSSTLTLTGGVVVKINQTITFNSLVGKTYGDADFTVSATSTSGLVPTFTSQTTGVCTVSGSTVHIVSAGSCTIRASQAGNGTYNAATPVDQAFTVAQKSLTPGLAGVVTKVYDNTTTAVLVSRNYTLTGIVGSDAVGLNNPSVGAYDTKDVGSGKTVTVNSLSLTGAQAGNYTLTTTSVSAAIGAITTYPITVTADPQNKVFGAGDPAFTYTVTSGSVFSGDLITGTLTRTSGQENVGSYPILQGTLTAGTDYNLTYVGANLTITPAEATITLGNLTQDYDGSAKAVSITTNPVDLTHTGVMYTGTGSTVYGPSMSAPTDAGTYSATASSTDPNQSGSDTENFTINKVAAVIVVTPYAVTYNGSAHTATGTATGVGSTDLSGSLVLTGTTHTNDGAYATDAWTFSGGTNYLNANGTVIDSIAKANASTTVNGFSGIYDGNSHCATGSSTGVNDESLSENLHLGDCFTNIPGGVAHWTLTFAEGANYNDANGDVDIIISSTTHMLNYSAGAHGSLTGSTTQMVVDGADGTAVTAVADSGFHFVSWSDESTANPRTDTGVTSNKEVTASFAANPVDETPTPPAPSSNNGGGNGPIAGSFGGVNGGSVLGASTSTVPGGSTGSSTTGPSCSALLTKYMRRGMHNDPAEVTKLQQFLKDHGYTVTVTGFFGAQTQAAVRKFQLDHAADILNPWGIKDPTGYVYKLTLYEINKLACPTLNAPAPTL